MAKVRIYHKFRDHKVSPRARILILGTFNPDIERNNAAFFYGRTNGKRHNHLWELLTTAFGENKIIPNEGTQWPDKAKEFMKKCKIDFADLIDYVKLKGDMKDYSDINLDKLMNGCKKDCWKDIEGILRGSRIKEVYLTRKTDTGIPNMKQRIAKIRLFCKNNKISFRYLNTPSRYYNAELQEGWNEAFKGGAPEK